MEAPPKSDDAAEANCTLENVNKSATAAIVAIASENEKFLLCIMLFINQGFSFVMA